MAASLLHPVDSMYESIMIAALNFLNWFVAAVSALAIWLVDGVIGLIMWALSPILNYCTSLLPDLSQPEFNLLWDAVGLTKSIFPWDHFLFLGRLMLGLVITVFFWHMTVLVVRFIRRCLPA